MHVRRAAAAGADIPPRSRPAHMLVLRWPYPQSCHLSPARRAEDRGSRRIHSARKMPGITCNIERRTPTEVLADDAADDISERRADRDGHVEDGERPSAGAAREEVGEQRGGDGPIGRLADADDGAGGEQLRVVAGESRETGRQTPEEDADGDRARPRAAVAEPPEYRRRQHVDDRESRSSACRARSR